MPKVQFTMTAEEVAEWKRKLEEGDLFPTEKHDLEERQIVDRLRELEVDGLLPYGAMAHIARELGVLPSRVSSWKERLGLHVEEVQSMNGDPCYNGHEVGARTIWHKVGSRKRIVCHESAVPVAKCVCGISMKRWAEFLEAHGFTA
ncbi:MAG: hypothetical protein ACOC9T_00135 [Myxococcota bacterium]